MKTSMKLEERLPEQLSSNLVNPVNPVILSTLLLRKSRQDYRIEEDYRIS